MTLDFHLVETEENPVFENIMDIMYDQQVFNRLIHDDICMEDIYQGMKTLTLIQVGVDGTFAGLFSLEDLGEHVGKRVVEVHAYLVPSMRRYSKMLIEEMINFIFANTSFDTIITSVSDRYPTILRFIKMAGFQEFMHREDIMSFGGERFGMHYLFHERLDIPIIQEQGEL